MQPAVKASDCSVREATVDDFPALSEVLRRNGLSSPKFDDWTRLWDDNPFRSDPPAPLGWVLENKSQGIVGTLSNIARRYAYNGEPVRVATASAWAVDLPFRTSAIFQARQFFSQKNVDLFLNTTASAPAAAIFKAFRCSEIPDPMYARVLFWIIRHTEFAAAALRKKGLPAIAGVRHAAGLALSSRDLISRPKAQYREMEACLLTRFDERFDAFWDVLRQRRNRLLAVRTSAALTWQFRPALENKSIAILAVVDHGEFSGYLIMARGDDAQTGLRRFRVVDLQAKGDERDLVLPLMSAALEHAKAAGVDVVEAVGFHPAKRDLLAQLNPRHRMYSSFPYLYKVRPDAPLLRDALKSADAWDASQFDGDASL